MKQVNLIFKEGGGGGGGGRGLKQMVIINLFISCLDFLIIEIHEFCFDDNINI